MAEILSDIFCNLLVMLICSSFSFVQISHFQNFLDLCFIYCFYFYFQILIHFLPLFICLFVFPHYSLKDVFISFNFCLVLVQFFEIKFHFLFKCYLYKTLKVIFSVLQVDWSIQVLLSCNFLGSFGGILPFLLLNMFLYCHLGLWVWDDYRCWILSLTLLDVYFDLLFYVSPLVFWSKWTCVLLTGKSSGPVGTFYEVCGALDSLWPHVRLKSFSEVVDKNMEASKEVFFSSYWCGLHMGLWSLL